MRKLWIILIALVAFMSITGGTMYSHGDKVVEGGDDMYMVSHSEYWSGEEGQIIARLYDWKGVPITVDNCTVNIYYPDKTSFIANGLTDDSLQATTGTHYYNFTTPTTEGVYQYMVTCIYDNKERTVANSFHLSPALNFIMTINDKVVNLTAQELAHFISVNSNLTSIRTELGVVDTNVDQLLLDVATVDGKADQIILDVADVQTDTTNIRANMFTQDNITIITDGFTNVVNNITVLKSYCNTTETSTSQLCAWVNNINTQVNSINITVGQYTGILNEINQTTHSTYDYITGTLASNINTLLGTTDRIETNTIQINQTVNTIQSNVTSVIQNQQEEVYMEVTS